MTKRLSLLTLIFAILSLTFFLLLIFLRVPFATYPLLSYQDALDILTALILIPIYWLMFRGVTRGETGLADELIFMVLAALFAVGQGMHLSANSINNLIGRLAEGSLLDVTATDLYTLTYFYDEYLSHYLWHIGVLGLAGLLVYESWHRPAEEKTNWWLVVPAGVLYGFTYFCIVIEGNTLAIGLPFAAAVTLLVLVWGRRKLAQQPFLAFFFVSCLLALLLFIGWGLYWGCFPPILTPTHC